MVVFQGSTGGVPREGPLSHSDSSSDRSASSASHSPSRQSAMPSPSVSGKSSSISPSSSSSPLHSSSGGGWIARLRVARIDHHRVQVFCGAVVGLLLTGEIVFGTARPGDRRKRERKRSDSPHGDLGGNVPQLPRGALGAIQADVGGDALWSTATALPGGSGSGGHDTVAPSCRVTSATYPVPRYRRAATTPATPSG